MKTWFTSDLHLGHEKVADHRGFASTDEHDTVILGNLHAALDRGDHLWILGDISSGTNRSERNALDKLNELTRTNTLHLIAGNHDSCHPMRTDAFARRSMYEQVFVSVQPYARRRLPDGVGKVWLSHLPFHGAGDREPGVERYPEVRLHDDGNDWIMHGHLHTPGKVSGPRSLHIGLDAWDLKPVWWEAAATLITRLHVNDPLHAPVVPA
ncbi:metallophosphoesterase family protein [Rhodococcus erythropolis]|uniref:metallophosphoesterase n=1 Tax=Rhodococcus erythropolis TaxID=1833 RepID=UPI0024B9F0E0|nr:metallophosphoesterase [Rhodococcus erythropolis]MDJ0404003.1 metallophosphoesterase family protein [Rhodococcus erythropolis]